MESTNGLVKQEYGPTLTFSAVQAHFGKSSNPFRIPCPAHNGENDSLTISRADDGGLLLTCHSRACPFTDILAGLCAKMGVQLRPAQLPKPGELTWTCTTAAGIEAVHVRYVDKLGKKGYAWKHLNSGGLVSKLPSGVGRADLIYRTGSADETPLVIVAEGEKSADAVAIAFPAARVVGTPQGAPATPTAEALLPALNGATTVVLWPDNDPGGQEQMQRMAALVKQVAPGAAVGFVNVDGIPEKGDAADLPVPARVARIEAALAAVEKERPAELFYKRVCQVDRSSPSWLWLPYLPMGAVSLLIGDQSTGKTAFAAWVAARVTKGEAFPNMARFSVPDEVPPAAFVAWFDSGENAGRIGARRFDAAGADGERLFFIEGTRSLKEVDTIRMLITSLPDRPKLVVFDNFLGFSSGIKLIDPGEVAPVIANLNRLATELDLAILVVHHDGKAVRSRASDVGSGAKALQNMARSVLIAGRHPEHEGVCVVAHTKCSEEAEGRQLAYNLTRENQPGGGTSVKCVPIGEVEIPVLWLVNGKPKFAKDEAADDKLSRCREWLKDKLQDGPQSAESMDRSASQHSYGKTTLREARKGLDIEVTRPTGGGTRLWRYRQNDEQNDASRAHAYLPSPLEPQEQVNQQVPQGNARAGSALRLEADEAAVDSVSQGGACPERNGHNPLKNKGETVSGQRASGNAGAKGCPVHGPKGMPGQTCLVEGCTHDLRIKP